MAGGSKKPWGSSLYQTQWLTPFSICHTHRARLLGGWLGPGGVHPSARPDMIDSVVFVNLQAWRLCRTASGPAAMLAIRSLSLLECTPVDDGEGGPGWQPRLLEAVAGDGHAGRLFLKVLMGF